MRAAVRPAAARADLRIVSIHRLRQQCLVHVNSGGIAHVLGLESTRRVRARNRAHFCDHGFVNWSSGTGGIAGTVSASSVDASLEARRRSRLLGAVALAALGLDGTADPLLFEHATVVSKTHSANTTEIFFIMDCPSLMCTPVKAWIHAAG